MKIGILTYHRSNNYGALLQAIALRKVISDMGHDVTYIDYWPSYHRHMYAQFSLSWMMSRKGVIGKVCYLKSCICNWTYRKERKDCFEKFIAENIKPYISSINDVYDVVVHGGDQIWRKQPEIKVYNPVYFGKHNVSTRRKISYAASMGIVAQTEEDKLVVKSYLPNLDKISVREESLKDLVQELGFDCEIHVDPVLLLNKEQWNSLVPMSCTFDDKYILYYCLQLNAFDILEIRKFTEKKQLKLKILYGTVYKKDTIDEIAIANSQDFLNLIRGAEFIFTSSFHGLAFSLIFQKPFFASYTKNTGRAKSLLYQLGLSQYLLEQQSTIPLDYKEIDYDIVDYKLSKMRVKSYEYLHDSMMI